MSSEAERQAVNVTPASASDTPGTGRTILAATTSAANTTIPDALFHRYVDIRAKGDEIWVALGPSTMANVDKTKAGGATFAAGTDDQNGRPMADGEIWSVRLDPALHATISWQANATNSKLIVEPSSQPAKIGTKG